MNVIGPKEIDRKDKLKKEIEFFSNPIMDDLNNNLSNPAKNISNNFCESKSKNNNPIDKIEKIDFQKYEEHSKTISRITYFEVNLMPNEKSKERKKEGRKEGRKERQHQDF